MGDPRGARARFGDVTAADVAALDAAAARSGIRVERLMDLAGWQVACCTQRWRGEAGAALVLAGSGNNGGDAIVAARHLAAWGWRVRLLALRGRGNALFDALLEEARPLCESVETPGEPDAAADAVHRLGAGAGTFVDGLLGTGVRGAPRELHAAVIEAIPQGVAVVAVDVPSGLDADTGTAAGACVRAEVTCTLAAVKTGLWAPVARRWCGEVMVADIGMPVAAWRAIGREPPDAVRGGALLAVPLAEDA